MEGVIEVVGVVVFEVGFHRFPDACYSSPQAKADKNGDGFDVPRSFQNLEALEALAVI